MADMGHPPDEGVDDPLFYALRTDSDQACAFWCARVVAQRATRGLEKARQESTYNMIVKRLQHKILVLVRESAADAERAKR